MITDNSSSIYSTNWDRFYSYLIKSNTNSLWDVGLEQSIEIEYPVFKNYFNSSLPVIDFGCGTGNQSCFLSDHFSKVVGLDASHKVIEKNKSNIKIKNVEFDVCDGLDLNIAQQLHKRLGDANVYIRGVLHQLREEDRPAIIRSIKKMMGKKGTIYMVEVLPELQHYLKDNSTKFSNLPLQMRAVFLGDLPITGLGSNEIAKLFPKDEFDIIHKGKTEIATLLQFDSGEFIRIPSAFYIIRNN